MKKKKKYINDLIRQEVSNIDPDAEIILFGSRARGNARPDSDWDVLILTGYPVNLSKERQFRDALYEIEIETGEPISVFVFSRNDWNTKQAITPFYHNVTREGITL